MKKEIRPLVRGFYDIQKLRIEMGNRIVAIFKHKLGQEPGEKEDVIDIKGKIILSKLRSEFSRITDGVKRVTVKNLVGYDLISTLTEFALAKHFGVKGVGPAMGGVIISEFDIEKAKYPSSLWMYAGLDVAPDGCARSKRKEHLRKTEYLSKDGNIKTKKGITFNPFLKAKLLGVLGPSFLKSKSLYAEFYYGYKNRLISHPKHKEKSDMHRHNMANRYMIKRFIVDLYVEWRKLEGLPVSGEYAEEKLSISH